jgi:hypothetical protein
LLIQSATVCSGSRDGATVVVEMATVVEVVDVVEVVVDVVDVVGDGVVVGAAVVVVVAGVERISVDSDWASAPLSSLPDPHAAATKAPAAGTIDHKYLRRRCVR